MKKLFLVGLAVMAMIVVLCADEIKYGGNEIDAFHFRLTRNVPVNVGTMRITNNFTEHAWELSNVRFLLPPDITNQFIIRHEHTLRSSNSVEIVVTNGFGDVLTNRFSTAFTNEAILTNTLLDITTTNIQSHIYVREDDFPANYYFLPNRDVLVLTFDTNVVRVTVEGTR